MRADFNCSRGSLDAGPFLDWYPVLFLDWYPELFFELVPLPSMVSASLADNMSSASSTPSISGAMP